MKKIIAAIIALSAVAAVAATTTWQIRPVVITIGASPTWTNTFKAVSIQSVAIVNASGTQTGALTVTSGATTNIVATNIVSTASYGSVTNVQWTFGTAPWSFSGDTWLVTGITNGTLLIGGFVPQ